MDNFPEHRMSFSTGHGLELLPTPFCRFRGAVATFDPTRAVLFSGDLFGSIEPASLVFKDTTLRGIRELHEMYMSNKEAVTRAVRALQRLTPLPKIVAPQHGPILRGEEIAQATDLLLRLKLGTELLDDKTGRRSGAKSQPLQLEGR